MNLFSLTDADIVADMRKSPDENVYEQKKVKEGYTAEESRNIPLKDSNVNYVADQAEHRVKVVSPGDSNAINKWADIIKVFANFVINLFSMVATLSVKQINILRFCSD